MLQYAATVALDDEEIAKNPERITKLKPFINKYNWEEVNFPSKKDDWKKIEKLILELLLMFCMLKKKKYVLLLHEK